MELMSPIVLKAIDETLATVDNDDQARTHGNKLVEEEIRSKLLLSVRKYVNRRNGMLTQKKEASIHGMLQETKSEMEPFIREAIANSIDDISEIQKSQYDKMIEKLLVPALVEAEKSEHVLTMLKYPIVKDEMKILIKQNDTSYSSANDLSDGIFGKMVMQTT